VIPDLVVFDRERTLREANADPSLNDVGRERVRTHTAVLTAAGCRYGCNLINAADQLAYQVFAIVFERESGSYLLPPGGKEFLSAREQAQVWMYADAQTDWSNVQSSLRTEYADAITFALPLLSPADLSFVAVLFRDGDDRL